MGAPTRPSCDMCASGPRPKWEASVTDITYGAERYSVCRQHELNPVRVSNARDFGPAPNNSTETSQEAAKSVEDELNDQCYLVLGAVAAAGPTGATREQVCKTVGVVNQAACARLNTLESHGLIVTDGEKRMADTRRLQQVYRLARVA